MKHPLAGKNVIFYFTAWLVIILIHTAVLHYHYYFSIAISLVDALVFNVLVAGLGFSYWYVVKFVTPESQGTAGMVGSHLAAILIIAMLIVYSAGELLLTFNQDILKYHFFIGEAFIWRMVLAVFYLGIMVLIYYLISYRLNLRSREQQEEHLHSMLRQSELEMLKFQINPHFIFNSLNSISSLTITDPASARDMVIRLSDFLRSSLGGQSPEKHALKDELNQMELYLEIERVRFGERLVITQQIDKECLSMTLPNMILQPIYENAIKYGIYEQLGEVAITTVCSCEDDNLKISISNNYDSEAAPQKGKGIGLKNVRNRLELTYGQLGLLTIEKQRTIFTVHLIIPQSHG